MDINGGFGILDIRFNTNYKNKGIDQLENVIKTLNDPCKYYEEIF